MLFDLLKPNEINVKPKQMFERNGKVSVMLLLYKDSRADMAALDKTVGPMYWKREHEVIGDALFCTVAIQNKATGEWVSKQDVGVESEIEKTKGEASDAFKRACTNWGIGREVYSAPNVFVQLRDGEHYKRGDKARLSGFMHFYVSGIRYDDNREIVELQIVDQNGNVRFDFGGKKVAPPKKEEPADRKMNRDEAVKMMMSFKQQGLDEYVPEALKLLGLHGLGELFLSKRGEFVVTVSDIAARSKRADK